ncbi:hypothetical protein CH063_10520 [Colletotrichum higginsianum]|uniref:Uncharacterized protein n=1 Tax=Colletotrichum higginsianum (strain IMI 349063) TaxID=759273 RepID=H1VHT3_COLHI|nr:hypothetical protein CH063_10520 [Colletotrichum higginsianum]
MATINTFTTIAAAAATTTPAGTLCPAQLRSAHPPCLRRVHLTHCTEVKLPSRT